MDERAVDTSGTAAVAAVTTVAPAGGAVEAARVLARLERIDQLDRERVPARVLLGELRELVHEAEAWARAEASGRSYDDPGSGGAGFAGAGAEIREGAEGMR